MLLLLLFLIIFTRAFPNNASVFATVTLFNRIYNKTNDSEDSKYKSQVMAQKFKECKEISALSSYFFMPDLFL